MVFINSEGKFNENTYLFDGRGMNIPKFLSVYVIENEGMRLMIDTPQEQFTRKFIKKLQEFGAYPIHKIVLTHSHFDHVTGTGKLRKLTKETDIEVLASANAIENLKNPEKMNNVFGMKISPIENVTPLKDGEIIDLNGLKLEVINLFGHTMDAIGIYDRKNKNLFPGCAVMNKYDHETFTPPFMPPDFNETEQLKTFQKLRNMKDELNSICLAHYGVWQDDDKDKTLNEMEELYYKTKKALIEWYIENPSIEDITLKYHARFIPNSKSHTKENIKVIQFMIDVLIESLKMNGFIELEATP